MPSSFSSTGIGGIAEQFVRFAGVGAIGTLTHYALLFTLVWLGGAPVSASACGFAAGALVNYTLNRRYTFRSRARHTTAFSKFMLIALCGLILNTLIMSATIDAGLHFFLAQLIATALVLVWNFTGNRLWTFKTA